VLAGTRLLRGEEENGRWELLAGHTTRTRAAAQGLAGLAAGWLTLLVLTAVFTVAIGQNAGPAFGVTASLHFSLAMCCPAALFLGIAAVAGQFSAIRRQAAMVAGALLGCSYVVRAAADSGAHRRWLRWLWPLGWVETLNPLNGSRPLELVPIGLALAACVALSSSPAGATSGPRRCRTATGPNPTSGCWRPRPAWRSASAARPRLPGSSPSGSWPWCTATSRSRRGRCSPAPTS
jgi:ABC-2 type transport system permease protein